MGLDGYEDIIQFIFADMHGERSKYKDFEIDGRISHWGPHVLIRESHIFGGKTDQQRGFSMGKSGFIDG